MIEDVSSFWWENITGPRLLLEQVAECLREGHPVILRMENRMVWRSQLPDLVRHMLNDTVFCTFSWEECKKEEILLRLMERLCPMKLRMCPGDYEAQKTFMHKEKVMGNAVAWFIPAGEQDLGQIITFISDRKGRNLETDGAYVLQVPAETRLPRIPEQVQVLNYSDYIRSGDALLFASILADGIRDLPVWLKRYASFLAASLSEGSAEIIPDILTGIDFAAEDPARAMLDMMDSGRIPVLDRFPEKEELDQLVWKAQIQTAFAGIEMERLSIVTEHSEAIMEAVSTEYFNPDLYRTGRITQKDDALESASDVELGTLTWMMALKRSDDWDVPLLSFPPDLRDWIIHLKNCRNSLAHHRVCSPEDMNRLLKNLQN